MNPARGAWGKKGAAQVTGVRILLRQWLTPDGTGAGTGRGHDVSRSERPWTSWKRWLPDQPARAWVWRRRRGADVLG